MAVAELSKIGNREESLIGEVDGCESQMRERILLMDGQVIGVVFVRMDAMIAVVTWSVTSPTTAGRGVM